MEREYFLRNAILIIDHGKDAMVSLVELDLTKKTLTFEQLINANQHEIYHLCISTKCCKCGPGYNPPKHRVLFPSQLEHLFDKSRKSSCHKSGSSNTFCCSVAKAGISTDVLDLTLARVFLFNFCLDVFWYSSLNFQGLSLEDFLNNNKHVLYHLWQHNTSCCCCDPAAVFTSNRPIIDQNQWNQMFSAVSMPCGNHRKRTHTGNTKCLCSMLAKSGVTTKQLDQSLRKIILQHCCSVWEQVQSLVQIRNHAYGHAKEGKMSNQDYTNSVSEIEDGIIEIAQVCNKETQFRQKIDEAKHGPLDETLCRKYEISLMDFIRQHNDLEQNLSEIAPKLDKISGKIASKSGKLSKFVHDTVRQMELTVEKGHTHFAIACHQKEGTFVETNAVRRCLKKSEKYDVFVITGKPGTGKSRIGLEILYRFGEMFDEDDLIRLTDLSEVKEVITEDKSFVLLLDDVFSKTLCPCNQETSKHVLDTLYGLKGEEKLKIIFTCRPDVRRKISSLFLEHKLFHNFYEINLDNEKFSMSDTEKEQLLLNCLCRDEFEIVDDINEENINDTRILNRKEVVRICKSTLRSICNTTHLIGFPYLCNLFTSNRIFTHLGLALFQHPISLLIKEINELRDCYGNNQENKLWYITLCCILINDNYLGTDRIDDHKLQQIIGKCSFQIGYMSGYKMKASAEQMIGKYLLYDKEKDCFQFEHDVVYEAVALSFYEVDPVLVIRVISLDFIKDLVRLNGYMPKEQEAVLVVPETLYVNLIDRLEYIYKHRFQNKSFDFVKFLSQAKLFDQNNLESLEQLIWKLLREATNNKMSVYFQNKCESVTFYFPVCLLLSISRWRGVENQIAKILDHLDIFSSKTSMKTNRASKMSILVSFYLFLKHEEPGGHLEKLFNTLFVNAENSDLLTATMISTCLTGNLQLLKILLQNVDNQHINIASGIESLLEPTAAKYSSDVPEMCRSFYMILYTLQHVSHTFIDMKKVINTACKWSNKCKSLVKWIVENVDHKLLDFATAIDNLLPLQERDDPTADLILYILQHIDCALVDIEKVMNEACKWSYQTLVKWIVDNVDHKLIDLNTAIGNLLLSEDRYKHDANLILYILQHVDHTLIDINKVMNEVCKWSYQSLVKWIVDNVDHKLIDLNTAIENLFSLKYRDRPDADLILYILQHVDHTLIDINKVMNEVCKWSDQTLVKWIVDNADHKLIDSNAAIENLLSLKYRYEPGVDLILYILQHVDHTLIDINKVMNEACKWSCQTLVEWIVDNVDHKQIDLNTAIDNLLPSEYTDEPDVELILYILQHVDHTLLDIKKVMNEACKWPYQCQSLVEWIVDNVDHKLIDLNAAINNLLLSEDREEFKANVILYILQHVDQTLIDINKVMNEACKWPWLCKTLVKWIVDNVDHKLIDLNAAINNLLLSEDRDELKANLILYILQHVDQTLIDIKNVMNEACKWSCKTLVEWIVENVDHKLIDLNTVIDNLLPPEDIYQLDADLILYILQHVDHTLIHIKKVMNEACKWPYQCQSLVEWIVDNVDHKLIDLNTVIDNLLPPEDIYQLDADLILYILQHVDHTLIHIKKVMNEACKWPYQCQSLVEWIVDNVDHKLIDLNTVIDNLLPPEDIYQLDADLILYILQHVDHTLIHIKKVMNEACKWPYQCQSLVEWIVDNVDHKLIDLNAAINKLLLSEYRDELEANLILYILQHVDHTLIDINKVMNEACKWLCKTLVEWIVDNVDTTLFDLNSAIGNLLSSEYRYKPDMDLIIYILQHVDHTLKNIKKVMKGPVEWSDEYRLIAKWIVLNVEHELIDFNSARVNLVRTEYDDDPVVNLILYLLHHVDHTLTDMKTVMNRACKWSDESSVKWIMVTVDHKQLDFNTAIDNLLTSKVRYKPIDADLILYILQHVHPSLIDITTVMNKACKMSYKCQLLVKWIVEKYDHRLLDLNTAIDNLLPSEDIIIYILQHVDHTLIDMTKVMHDACKWSWLCKTLVKWIVDNVDHKLIDLNTAIDNLLLSEDNFMGMNTYTQTVNLIIYILQHVDHTLIDMTKVMHDACKRSFQCQSLVEWIVQNCDHRLLNFQTAIYRLLHSENKHSDEALLLYILQNVDIALGAKQQNTDISVNLAREIMDKASRVKYSSVILWLLQHEDENQFDLRKVMNERCYHGDIKTVEWLWHNTLRNQYDMRSAMIKACRGRNICDTVEWLWNNVDHNTFDLNTSLYNACRHGNNQVVEWMVEQIPCNLFDMGRALLNTCQYGDLKTVECLIPQITLLDLQMALESACKNVTNGLYIIKRLLNYNTQYRLDMNRITQVACEKSRTDIVRVMIERQNKSTDFRRILNLVLGIKIRRDVSNDHQEKKDEMKKKNLILWILRKCNPAVIDITAIMTEVCTKGWMDVLLWIWKTIDHNLVDIKTGIDLACQYGRQEIIDWAVHNVDKKYMDFFLLMNESCGYGWIKQVEWLWQNIDHTQFDIRTSMNEACTYRRKEVVDWLINNIDLNLFDLNTVLMESCKNGWLNVITVLLENGKPELINLRAGVTAACVEGHINIVEFLFSKVGQDVFDLHQLDVNGYSKNKDVITFLLGNFDSHKDLNLSVILTKASGSGWTDIVKNILSKSTDHCFDWTAALINACDNGETEVVEILLNRIEPSKVNMKIAMILVCRHGWEEIATIMLDTVDHTYLGINNALQEACRYGEQQIVEMIVTKCSPSQFEISNALDKGCINKLNENLILWILERYSSSDIDIQNIKVKALEHGWHNVMYFLQNMENIKQ